MSCSIGPEGRRVAAAVRREFGLHYLADELPHPVADQRSAYYDGSARRLRSAVGDANVGALVALLRAMRDDPGHPLVRAIEDEPQFDWSEHARTWAAFQQLIDGIDARLRG